MSAPARPPLREGGGAGRRGGRLLTRFGVVFGALAAKALVSFAIVFFALERAEHHVARANLAHVVYERYLDVSAQSWRLFKRLEDEILIDADPARRAGTDALASEVRTAFDDIRAAIAAEIELVGEGEVEELGLLAQVEGALSEAMQAFRRLHRWRARGDPRYALALRATLEGGAYRAFRTAVAQALAGEAAEVVATEAETARQIAGLRLLAACAFTLGLGSAAVALRALRRDLMGPVARLSAGAAALGAGDMAVRIAETGPRELADLAAAFNAMAARVGARERDLAAARDTLEARVAARTAELELALTRVADADRLRRRLLSDVSHELRTPLTIIRGEAEFALRGGGKPPAAYRDALGRARDAAMHCARIVEDLLYVARAEEGAVRLVIGPVDLAPLLAEKAVVARSLTDDARGVVRFNNPTRAPAMVRGDGQRIRQAVLILIENALRHGGGDVTLGLERKGDVHVVSVADTGPGMTPEEVAAAFQRFHRGPAAERCHARGAGLGLSVARAIVEAHGGRIALVSAPGAGTTASFTLPAASA